MKVKASEGILTLEDGANVLGSALSSPFSTFLCLCFLFR